MKKRHNLKKIFAFFFLCTCTLVQAQTIKTVNRNEEITLSATEDYETYQWQISSDNKLYMDLPSATSSDYNFKATVPCYYRIKATPANGNAIFLDTTQIAFTKINYIEGGRKFPISNGYIEVDGKKGSGITMPISTAIDAQPYYSKEGKTFDPDVNILFWENTDAHAIYYAHMQKAKFDINLPITTRIGKNYKIHLLITDPNDPTHPIADNYLCFAGISGKLTIPAASLNITTEQYYRFDLSFIEGNKVISYLHSWQFNYDTDGDVYPPGIMANPAPYIWWGGTTNTSKPTDDSFDWCYQEVMIPKEYDISCTYALGMGLSHGYIGIQNNGTNRHDINYSIWDDGNTDVDDDLESYKKAGSVDAADMVHAARFGGEGSGSQAFLPGDHWIPGTYVKFLLNSRAEVTTYEIIDKGVRKTITRNTTLITAWFDANDGKGWQFISTTRLPCDKNSFNSWYSFLENYDYSTGQLVRKSYYRNAYAHSSTEDKWYHYNKVQFSQNTGTGIGGRDDFTEKIDPEDPSAFIMQAGGFLKSEIGNNVVNYGLGSDGVENIDTELLNMRIDLSLKHEAKRLKYEKEITDNLYDESNWRVMRYSSQDYYNTAAHAIDGENGTYWNTKITGNGAQPPHSLILDMMHIQPINGLQFILDGGINRHMKDLKLYASNNFNDWHEIYSTDEATYVEKYFVPLDSTVNTRFLKIVIESNWINDVDTRIYEINVSHPSSYDPTDIKSVKTANNETVELKVSTNTDSKYLNIVVPATSDKMIVDFYNTFGGKVFSTTFYNQNINEEKNIKIPFLVAGVYIVKVKANKKQYSNSIIIH